MSNRLQGKVAVCTGSGRGIGRCIALALAAEGASIVVNDYGIERDGSTPSSGPALDVAEEIRAGGGQAVANYDSVATIAGGRNIVQAALEAFGHVDILCNAAGVLHDRSFLKMSEAEWDDVIAVHLKGHFACIQPAAEQMKKQRWGRVLSFSSSSIFGNFGQANYAAAKMGILGLTRAVALELGPYGVTANAILPVARTRMTWSPEMEKTYQRIEAEGQKLAELPPPEAIAPLVVYLCSEAGANINGQALRAAGGEIGLYEFMPMTRMISKDIGRYGLWTQEELEVAIPQVISHGMTNQWPPKPAQ